MWETKQGRESCTNPLTDQGSSPHLTCCLRSPHLPKGHQCREGTEETLTVSKSLEVANGWEGDGREPSTHSWACPGTGKVAQRLQMRPVRVSSPV